MHVSVVSPEFPPAIGGVETYAVEYCKALVALGHRVTVHTLRHRQGEVRIDGIDVLPTLRMRWHEDRRTLAGFKADAWHAMNAACAWLAEDHPGLVVSVHGNDFLRPYYPLAQLDWKRIPGAWRFETGFSPAGQTQSTPSTRACGCRARARVTAGRRSSYPPRPSMKSFPRWPLKVSCPPGLASLPSSVSL